MLKDPVYHKQRMFDGVLYYRLFFCIKRRTQCVIKQRMFDGVIYCRLYFSIKHVEGPSVS